MKQNNYEEVQKNTATLKNLEVAKLAKDAKAFEETLVNKVENAKIPEVFFKEHFLDFFKNYNKDTAPTEADTTAYAQWLSIAGSEYNEVDVTNEKGETLFATPPLLTKPTINYNAAMDLGINKVANEALNQFNRTPAESSNYITNQVTKFMSGAISVDTREDTYRWSKILKRYSKTEEDIEKAKIDEQLKKMPLVMKEDLGLKYD